MSSRVVAQGLAELRSGGSMSTLGAIVVCRLERKGLVMDELVDEVKALLEFDTTVIYEWLGMLYTVFVWTVLFV